MPRGDRSGPLGQGPKTGRGAGLCSGDTVPGFAGRFRGCRWGRGRNWNRPGIQRDEKDTGVIDQIKSLRNQLSSIEEKIKGLRDR